MNAVLNKRPLTESQKRALDAMPELEDSVFPKIKLAVPASVYIDPERFELEKSAVFRRVPMIAGPSALLPEPRGYFRQDLAGMPVLVTRDKEGTIHAFANVCRHRGSVLCTGKDPVSGGRIVCPYHAWTYGLDGTLIGIPRQETFPGIDKKDFALTPLPCVEAGGLIWVGLESDPARAPDFLDVTGAVSEDLDAVGLADMHVFDRVVFDVNANWKLVMDSMLDSYHVTRLHKDTLAKFFVDTENVVDIMGPHIRAAAARGNFKRALISDDFEQVRQIMVFAYTLFPNGIIVASPDFISVGIVRPLATDRTEIDYYMLVNEEPSDERTQGKLRRSFDLMKRAFGEEDYWAAEMCDRGLRSGAVQEVVLGGMEIQISHFHEALDRFLSVATQTRAVGS